MNNIIKIAAVIIIMAAFLSTSTQAADTSFELNVGSHNVEGRIDVKINPFETPLTVGGGFIYKDDSEEYWLANANAALKDEVFTPGLSLGVGLKGVFGKTDFITGEKDTFALPFLFLGDFDFRKTSLNIPVSITANIAYAPDVLSFSDTKRYFEFYTAGYFHINYFAALFVGYRNIDIDYKSGGSNELSDDTFYFGVRMSF